MSEETSLSMLDLGTVEIKSTIADRVLSFPTALHLSIHTSPEGAAIDVEAAVDLLNLQSDFDAIVKSFPMPNDTSGYGTKITARIASASLQSQGDTAVLEANVDATVWQIEKGIPGGGATVRWETRCVDLGWLAGKICTDVPVSVEVPPGPDIKLELIKEGFNARVNLSLATTDGQSVELRPGEVAVNPRGDLGRFVNDLAGIFSSNLSAIAQRELGEIVNDGTLRQALPKEIAAFSPGIKTAQFFTTAGGSLGMKVSFHALLTPEQLAEWIRQSIQR